MTDRIRRLTVILDRDYREDDVQRIIDAISMVRGVALTESHVNVVDDYVARKVVKQELLEKLQAVLLE